ncbi:MAG: valine--tRNA ligase [Alphaproteobacteria bacterium]|nr:valine--tRNA ligase [Alphaproteobacteria bacterium]
MLEKSFDFAAKESDIGDKWIENDLFAADPASAKPPFCIMIPPPNVTGSLHMGHALNNAVQDCLCRFKRMRGFDVLWQPGTDHAGIATQMVVERILAKDGVSRHDLGRDKFVEKIWEWKEKSGGQIIHQLHKLGASCDWARERFTMDEGLSAAVRKVFVQLYREGLIYKDKRLVNWDSKLQTAISDLEVEQRETIGTMWYMAYPVEGSADESICVATTRPETMFGDTAVAVSADDERYKHLIGKNVILPIANRPIPVIADEHADPAKGTGAVKITPAHDFNDFEVGKRHNLPLINILDREARLNDAVPEKYRGMGCLDARPLVLADIKALGLYVKEENNPMTIPYGDRSGVVIEPWLTDQWFVNAKELAKDAIAAVRDGRTRFVPKNWENTYYEWMNNIQPWCISRQLWWGHQVPVWYGPDGAQFCAETEAEAQAAADKHYGKTALLTRDTDVLDTWFSSGLWAFSTLGWPEQTAHLKRYYPTSVLVTAFDIIFFWVARMMMMSLHFMKEVPFREICIHGLVRDEKGQKMSKSKGNGIDPLDISAKYGMDALRFALLIQAGHGRDVLMSDERVEGYRNFVTKIWNAAKFCEMNGCVFAQAPAAATLPVNAWILTKLDQAAQSIAKDLDGYAFNEAAHTAYHFVWGTFCDWYLEATKPIFRGTDAAAIQETKIVMGYVLENMLKLLHPFMPFVTEEIWAETAARPNMLMAEAWPDAAAFADDKTAAQTDWLFDLVAAIRSTKAEVRIPAPTKIDLVIKEIPSGKKDALARNEDIFKTLARVESIRFSKDAVPGSVTQVFGDTTFVIPLNGLIDIAAERKRLTQEIENLKSFITRTEAHLSNDSFVSKAPAAVVADKKKSLADARDAAAKMEKVLGQLTG